MILHPARWEVIRRFRFAPPVVGGNFNSTKKLTQKRWSSFRQRPE